MQVGCGQLLPSLVTAFCSLTSSRRKKIQSLSPPNENEKAPLLWALTVTEAWIPSVRNVHAAPPLSSPRASSSVHPLSTAAPTARFSQQPEAVQKQIMVEVLCPWLLPKSPKSHLDREGSDQEAAGQRSWDDSSCCVSGHSFLLPFSLHLF